MSYTTVFQKLVTYYGGKQVHGALQNLKGTYKGEKIPLQHKVTMTNFTKNCLMHYYAE